LTSWLIGSGDLSRLGELLGPALSTMVLEWGESAVRGTELGSPPQPELAEKSVQSIAEVLKLLQQTNAADFAGRHASEDLILVEPYQKKRSYGQSSPLHTEGTVRFVARSAGVPIPAGRDARSKILLDHRSISRLHAVIAYTPEGWKIMDKSSNGCWLSGTRCPKDQAIDLPYGAPLRLGKAVVLRMFGADAFFRYATGGPAPTGGGVASQAAPSTADTWRLSVDQIQAAANAPSAPPPQAQPPVQPLEPLTASKFDIDFDFGDEAPQGAPTMRISRGDLKDGTGAFPRPGAPPGSPFPPPANSPFPPPPAGSPFPPPPGGSPFPPPPAGSPFPPPPAGSPFPPPPASSPFPPPPAGSPFPPPGGAPPPPAGSPFPPPAAAPPPAADDDFEFDFDVDGRGGF
jgi:predicted component of type VI protein secretion system